MKKQIIFFFIFFSLIEVSFVSKSFSSNTSSPGSTQCQQFTDSKGQVACTTTFNTCGHGLLPLLGGCEEYFRLKFVCPKELTCVQPTNTPTPTPLKCKTENQPCVEGIPGRNDCNNGTPECAKYTCQVVSAETVVGYGYCAYDPNFKPSLPLDLQSRCKSVTIDQIPNCQYKISSSVVRCGDNSQGFVCSSPEEVLCMNGEKKEANVVCTKLPPIAQPCKKFVLISDGKTDVTDRVKGNDIDSNKEPFTCAELKTAVGDISTDPKNIIQKIFAVLLSLSGGIALLLIIVSGYHFIASQGNPEKIQGAKETLTSAIVGLLFIIFSMVILEVIGVDILRIPGLGR